jgi:uncharacterized membrane protein
VNVLRVLRHLFTPRWVMRLRYPTALLEQITQRIAAVEQRRHGELRFVVEHALELDDLLAGSSARDRALELFGHLRVWDTEGNDGVLIYVLHAEHAVEIVADRAMARAVPPGEWDALCHAVEPLFRAGRYGEAALAAVDGAARLMERYVPAQALAARNELPDQPLLL